MSKRILIVEDEESIADLEKDYLELSNFEVEVANDGETGLKKGMEGDFDLIILDLMLPGVDGFEICRQIRGQKNTPIIMVSAKKDDIDKIRGLGLGADDYMTKPVQPERARRPSEGASGEIRAADRKQCGGEQGDRDPRAEGSTQPQGACGSMARRNPLRRRSSIC